MYYLLEIAVVEKIQSVLAVMMNSVIYRLADTMYVMEPCMVPPLTRGAEVVVVELADPHVSPAFIGVKVGKIPGVHFFTREMLSKSRPAALVELAPQHQTDAQFFSTQGPGASI